MIRRVLLCSFLFVAAVSLGACLALAMFPVGGAK